MRTTATAIFFLLAAPLTLVACGPSDDNHIGPDMAMAGGGGEDDMSVQMPGDMRMQLPADMATTDQIQLVKNAADHGSPDGGTLDLPLDHVIVTYLHPAIGADPAGFFVQEHMTGPAIFIAVDPTSLSPAPVVGDTVSFTVTGAQAISKLRMVTSLDSWTRDAQGFDLSTLVQDVSAKTDLVTMLDNYDGELIKVTGTIAADFASAGTAHVSAAITTAGVPTVPTGTGAIATKLRLPATMQDNIDAVKTCTFVLNKVPLWRNSTQPQPSAWVPGDITLTACPTPQVASASSLDLTTVRVKISRNVKPSTFLADGSQFTINGGVTVMSATLSGRFVDLVTSTQTAGTLYTVTVANSIHDLLDQPLDAAHLTANFHGYSAPAQVVINEVNQAVTGNKDLVELRVTTAGTLENLVLQQDIANTKTTLATLPYLFVAVDDLVVLHLTADATVTTETTDKMGCTDAQCFGGAWDIAVGAANITNSDRLLAVLSPDGTYQDVVAFTSQPAASGRPAGFPAELQAAQAAGQWMPADCAGSPCTYTTTPTAEDISVVWKGVSTSPTGVSVQRLNPAGTVVQTHSKADWTAAPIANTFGLANN